MHCQVQVQVMSICFNLLEWIIIFYQPSLKVQMKILYWFTTLRIFQGSKRIILTSLFFYSHLITAKHHQHRHSFAKKLTHTHFPKGGYIIVHYPLAHHIFASNQNQLDGKALSSESGSNEFFNDIPSNDINLLQDSSTTPTRRHNDSVKNKYIMKFKRNINDDELFACCRRSPRDSCVKLNC